jgi:CHAD domain-containing protein
MAFALSIPSRAGVEHRDLVFWMKRAIEELQAVQAEPSARPVHDLRVALRRCRSIALAIHEIDPHPDWEELRRRARKLFRSLGDLRDAHVMGDWLKEIQPHDDPVKSRLLDSLASAEESALQKALENVSRFDEKGWKKLERSLRTRIRRVPPDGDAACCLAVERLDEAIDLHRRALRSERPKPWHRLRIGLKHFRYTVESFLPAVHAKWSESLKRVQDVLGEIHDLDVLFELVQKVQLKAGEGGTDWEARIAEARAERIETYRQLALGTNGVWPQWSGSFPPADRPRYATARIAATRKAMDPKPQKSLVLSRLALRLWSQLRAVRAAEIFLNPRERALLTAAARLSGICKASGGKPRVKSARTFLLKSPVPPGWTFAEWERAAWAIRFQRGADPGAGNKRYSKLPAEQRTGISLHAGLLRLARGLQRCGLVSGRRLTIERLPQGLLLHVAGIEESPENAASLTEAKRLIERTLGSPILVQPVAGPDAGGNQEQESPLAFTTAR